jgi:hypothetical protein
MVTLLTIRTDVRNRLDEVSARRWTDAELNNWINEGLRDVARRSETILSYYTNIALVPNVAKYSMPTDVIRVHRLEFVPVGSSQTYPIQLSTYQEMDQVWGVSQQIQRSYPYYAVLWGFAPNITIQFYPVPSQAGELNIYYYRLPTTLVNDIDVAEIPAGWEDLVEVYCEYVALRKDRDVRWQDSKTLYETSLQNMINVTRQLHDQARSVIVGTSAVPAWLYEFED